MVERVGSSPGDGPETPAVWAACYSTWTSTWKSADRPWQAGLCAGLAGQNRYPEYTMSGDFGLQEACKGECDRSGFSLSILLGLAANLPLTILGSMDVPRRQSGSLAAEENATAAGARSGESLATISGSVLRFAVRVVQSSKDPNAVDEGSCDGREDRIHPREADIEGFHFL